MTPPQEYVSLALYSTFGVGGDARFFVDITSADEVSQAVVFAKEQGIPLLILGGSSNILVSDEGFPGLVAHITMKGHEVSVNGDQVFLKVGAGESWDSIVALCVEQGWSGIECLSGIPGSVGAAPVQNIGAYGHSIAEVLYSVDVFDRKTGAERSLTADECQFSYRSSIFKAPEGASFIITHVTLRLSRTATAPIPSYHDFAMAFHNTSSEVPLVDIRKAVIEARAKKGMVIILGYEQFKSAGSFFKNPVVPADIFSRTQSIVQSHPDGSCTDPWSWPQSDGRIKVSAACLMECAGFPKGFTQGNVGISPRHALAIINRGGARASDIAALAVTIQKKVYDLFGIELEREVQYIGF